METHPQNLQALAIEEICQNYKLIKQKLKNNLPKSFELINTRLSEFKFDYSTLEVDLKLTKLPFRLTIIYEFGQENIRAKLYLDAILKIHEIKSPYPENINDITQYILCIQGNFIQVVMQKIAELNHLLND